MSFIYFPASVFSDLSIVNKYYLCNVLKHLKTIEESKNTVRGGLLGRDDGRIKGGF